MSSSPLECPLLIAGQGAMVQELKRLCTKQEAKFETFPTRTLQKYVGVNLGGQKTFLELLEFCKTTFTTPIPVLQCSSGVKMPLSVDVPIVNVPNASEFVILFLWFIQKLSGHLLEREMGNNWKLEESHQHSKRGASGTALRVAELLDIAPGDIVSDRSSARIHASHRLVGSGGGIKKMEFSIEIEGREAYALGMLALARRVHNRRAELKNKIYDASEFVT